MSDFNLFLEKMQQAGVSDAAVRSFKRNYELLGSGESGMVSEAEIVPPEGVVSYEDLPAPFEEKVSDLLSQTIMIKLNGGLGTGMGLQKAKSLLEVREGETFLDIIVKQIKLLRKQGETRFMLMNSFSTSEDVLSHLQSRYEESYLTDPDQVELMQNQVPKISKSTLKPAGHQENPALEWCPPGHGDLYPALLGSGVLDRLLGEGVKYAFVSNSDNLGAVLDPRLLSYFAECEAPFLMEVTRRTEADKKGGHLAQRLSDQRLVLREVAQCPEEDLESFQNIEKHQFFNTNNLWLRLDLLKKELVKGEGVLPLPMIKNVKTIDPRDPHSEPVYQLETAMGAAIECFDESQAVCVPRSRFAPVKTTGDLLALRSDAYEEKEDGSVGLIEARQGIPPLVILSKDYKLVDSLEDLGVPSLKECQKLEVTQKVHLDPGQKMVGEVIL